MNSEAAISIATLVQTALYGFIALLIAGIGVLAALNWKNLLKKFDNFAGDMKTIATTVQHQQINMAEVQQQVKTLFENDKRHEDGIAELRARRHHSHG